MDSILIKENRQDQQDYWDNTAFGRKASRRRRRKKNLKNPLDPVYKQYKIESIPLKFHMSIELPEIASAKITPAGALPDDLRSPTHGIYRPNIVPPPSL
jgi:hypothetical protein